MEKMPRKGFLEKAERLSHHCTFILTLLTRWTRDACAFIKTTTRETTSFDQIIINDGGVRDEHACLLCMCSC